MDLRLTPKDSDLNDEAFHNVLVILEQVCKYTCLCHSTKQLLRLQQILESGSLQEFCIRLKYNLVLHVVGNSGKFLLPQIYLEEHLRIYQLLLNEDHQI